MSADSSAQDSTQELAVRREQLRLRSAQLRERIAARGQVLRPGFRAVDRMRGGWQAVRGLRQHRTAVLLAGAALAGMALARPRLALDWGLRAWSGWQLLRRLQPLISGLRRPG